MSSLPIFRCFVLRVSEAFEVRDLQLGAKVPPDDLDLRGVGTGSNLGKHKHGVQQVFNLVLLPARLWSLCRMQRDRTETTSAGDLSTRQY